LAITKQAPLAGKRVVITRSPEQAQELVRQLEQLGAEVLLLPTLTFDDPRNPAPLDQAIRGLEAFHWVLFTSQNAVRFFSKRCRTLGLRLGQDGRASTGAQPRIGAVGPATAEAAEKEGLRVDYVATQFRGKALAEELGVRLVGRKVLLPRSDRASTDLPAALRAKGAAVVEVVAYHTGVPESLDHSVSDAIRRGDVDVVSFLSPSAFHHLVEELGLETLRGITGQVALAAIGPVTAGAIRDAGLPVEIEALEATAPSLVAAITRYLAQRLPPGGKSP